MRKPALLLTLAAAGALPSGTAQAGTPYEVELTCPVGGEEFSHTSTASFSTWGSRPDGKPYGSWVIPMPLPECPSNRLVMFREFEEEEIEKLSALVQSDQYIALHDQTTYYRAQWLADHLSEDLQLPWLLVRAVWQTDEKPEQRRAYLAEFAKRAGALPYDRTDFESAYLRFLVANAHRELGQFNDALATLENIEIHAAQQTDENWKWLSERLPLLEQAIVSMDSDIEPLRLIPDSMARWKCDNWREVGRIDIDPYCATLTDREAEIEDSDSRRAAAAADAASADVEASMEAAEEAMEDAGPIGDAVGISSRTDFQKPWRASLPCLTSGHSTHLRVGRDQRDLV